MQAECEISFVSCDMIGWFNPTCLLWYHIIEDEKEVDHTKTIHECQCDIGWPSSIEVNTNPSCF